MYFEFNRRSFLKKSFLCGLSVGLSPFLTPFQSSYSEIVNHKAKFFKRGEGYLIQCELCFRQCLIPEGKRGFCKVRENRKGELRSLVYGRPGGLQIDPIELEPMYHMAPGHKNLCVYTASCNFEDDVAFGSLQCSIGAGVDGNDPHAIRLAMVFRLRHRQ